MNFYLLLILLTSNNLLSFFGNKEIDDLNKKIDDANNIFTKNHNIDTIKKLINERKAITNKTMMYIHPDKNLDNEEFFTNLWRDLTDYNTEMKKSEKFMKFLQQHFPEYIQIKKVYDKFPEYGKTEIPERIKGTYSHKQFSLILKGMDDPGIFYEALQPEESISDAINDKAKDTIRLYMIRFLSEIVLQLRNLEPAQKSFIEDNCQKYFQLKDVYYNFTQEIKYRIYRKVLAHPLCDFFTLILDGMNNPMAFYNILHYHIMNDNIIDDNKKEKFIDDLKTFELDILSNLEDDENKMIDYLEKNFPGYSQLKTFYDYLNQNQKKEMENRVNKKPPTSQMCLSTILAKLEKPIDDFYNETINMDNKAKNFIISSMKIFISDILYNRFTLAGFYFDYTENIQITVALITLPITLLIVFGAIEVLFKKILS